MTPSERYSDDRLDDRFAALERRTDDLDHRLQAIEIVRLDLANLTANVGQMDRRLDRFREDTTKDFDRIETELTRQRAVMTGLLVSLLVAMLGAIVAIVVVL